MKNKIKFGLILIAMAFISASCNRKQDAATPQVNNHSAVLTIGTKTVHVEIADTETSREQGLSNRKSLPENSGMLFIFDLSARHGFWMKETLFPLDFIWIEDNKVAEITENVPIQLNVPESELKLYSPANPVNWVLEVNAGWAANNGIKAGDRVELK